ncbi:MAG TPA: ankyrin repeat domain-containing protein, partial [Myxococcota bacterium]|nr:ankyrin repeat domain-containing protein [Myxococcota bacterium]
AFFDVTAQLTEEVPAPPPTNAIEAALAGDVRALSHFLKAQIFDTYGAIPRERMPEYVRAELNRPLDDARQTYALLAARDAYNPEEALRYISAKGGSVDLPDAEGNTPLLAIAERGDRHLGSLALLVRRKVDVNAANVDGLTALTLVVRSWQTKLVPALQVLIQGEVDLNKPGPQGILPSVLLAAHAEDPGPAFAAMLAAYPNAPARQLDANRSSPVPGQPGVNFGTALVALARYSHRPHRAVAALIARGASVHDALDNMQAFAVYGKGRSYARAEELLRKAAAEAGLDAQTIEAQPVEQPYGIEDHNPWTAAAAGRADLMKYYMTSLPHQVVRPQHRRDGHALPLALAAENGQMNVLRLLLENAEKVNEKLSGEERQLHVDMVTPGHPGETPLFYAIRGNAQRAIRYLLNQGADARQILTRKRTFRPDERYSLLDLAIKEKNAFAAVELLRWGAAQTRAGKASSFDPDQALETAQRLAARDPTYTFVVKRIEHYKRDVAIGRDPGTHKEPHHG